jgi:hypothetical protein
MLHFHLAQLTTLFQFQVRDKMPTKSLRIMPWSQGLNTTADASMLAPGELTQADHIVMGTRLSKRKRDGINHGWDSLSTGSLSVLRVHDFWYGTTSRTQTLVGVYSDKSFKKIGITDGTVTALTDAGTAWTGTITNVSTCTYNNLCIMASDVDGNVLKKYAGSGNVEDLDGTPPVASILREFQGRLFTNDKTNLDRLHFSPVHDHTQWNGAGDSGAIDIGIGDGDPNGITGIFPSFKGDMFIAKLTKLYRMRTFNSNDPADWVIDLVSSGIGCVSHNSIVAIEQDDVFWASERGIHSLSAVQAYGDFEATFISAKIQKTYNEDIARGRLKYIQGAYDSTINSVAFTFTDNTVANVDAVNSATLYGTALTTASNNSLYLYNIGTKQWYRWPGTSCQSIVAARDSSDNKIRFFLGTKFSRISRTKTGAVYDITHADVNKSIIPIVKTGFIFPDVDPYNRIALKRVVLYYKPEGTHNVVVNVRLDNQSLSTKNSLSFQATTSSGLLGTTFILGVTELGYESILGPYHRVVSGVGRGIQVEITNTGINEVFEIQGLGFEFEPLDQPGEVT